MRALLIATLLPATVAGCDLAASVTSRPKHPAPRVAPAPRLEATLQLPAGDGRVHIVAMPSAYLEVTRCIVAVGPNGQAAVSCAPKDLDVPPPPEQ